MFVCFFSVVRQRWKTSQDLYGKWDFQVSGNLGHAPISDVTESAGNADGKHLLWHHRLEEVQRRAAACSSAALYHVWFSVDLPFPTDCFQYHQPILTSPYGDTLHCHPSYTGPIPFHGSWLFDKGVFLEPLRFGTSHCKPAPMEGW